MGGLLKLGILCISTNLIPRKLSHIKLDVLKSQALLIYSNDLGTLKFILKAMKKATRSKIENGEEGAIVVSDKVVEKLNAITMAR